MQWSDVSQLHVAALVHPLRLVMWWQLLGTGVTLYMACPGFVDTPMIREAQKAAVRSLFHTPSACLRKNMGIMLFIKLLHVLPSLRICLANMWRGIAVAYILDATQSDKVKELKASFVPTMMTAAQVGCWPPAGCSAAHCRRPAQLFARCHPCDARGTQLVGLCTSGHVLGI